MTIIDLEVIEKGLMTKEDGRFLRTLSEARGSADYTEAAVFTEKEVEEFIKGARQWVAKAEKLALQKLKQFEE